MLSVDNENLQQVVQSIWTQMLGLQLMPQVGTPAQRSGACVSASVEISGAWSGRVLVRCSLNHARRVAAGFFGMEHNCVDQKSLLDTLGELANMTGGAVKRQVASPSSLSIPTTRHDNSWPVTHAENVLVDSEFACEGELISVAVLALQAPAVAG